MAIKSILRDFWFRLTGNSIDFSLPTRLFHSICLISLLALAYNIPLNYIVGLPNIAIISFASALFMGGLYYLSRFRQKTALAVVIFCVIGNLLFAVNYFLNEGIHGPTDLFFVLTVIMMVMIIPVKQYWFWVCGNIGVVLTLHYLQYVHPEWVPSTYNKLSDQYFDISSAYITVVLVALMGFYLLRRSYEREKISAEHKAGLMKLLNEEKNKLFSIIAHDLRAPLSNIHNYLGLLRDGDIGAEERAGIELELHESTGNTLEMLNNVLSWSKSQMNGITITLVRINVYELLAPELLLSLNIAKTKKITVEISIDPKLTVFADGDTLKVVVRNLVNNAIKFTAEGGKINVTATNLNDSCLITVKDSGNGRPAKLSQDIFNLNAASTFGTNNEKGVGLGLVLCKEFVEAQGGTISFECHPQTGASFSVTLPIAK